MALIDMKRPKSKPSKMEAATYDDGEKFPYGLRISLENEELSKLGINVKDLDVGKELTIKAIAKVDRVEDRDSSSGGRNQSASLQIVKLDIEKPKGKTARHFDNLNQGPE
jgi:hypothetical protein